MITLDRLWELLSIIFGGGLLASVVANKKNKNDDKQKIIDQLQEDRKEDRQEINNLKVKMDNLYSEFYKLKQDYSEKIHENAKLKWQNELKDEEIKEKDQHIKELETKVEELEGRVSELEEERRNTNGTTTE